MLANFCVNDFHSSTHKKHLECLKHTAALPRPRDSDSVRLGGAQELAFRKWPGDADSAIPGNTL